MTYRTNMPYRGSNNLARLLYDTNCQMFEVTPLTIRANSDAIVECLPEAMERVITELKKEYLLDESMKLFHQVVELASTELSIEFTEEQIACHKETMGELIRLGYSNPVWMAASHHEREGVHRSPLTNSTHWFYFSDLIEKTAATYLFFESSEQVLEKVGLEWVTKEGRFPKRVSSYFWKNYGITLSKEQLTKLGNDFDKCRIPKETFYMRITNNFNWQDGEYGKEGSCWWASYGHSRDTLHHHGGYGVLFYKDAYGLHDDDGIGRMWLSALDDNMAVGFNYYGPSQDRYIAAAVARMLEILTNESWVYGKRDLAHCGGMYVNDGVGFLFYKKGTEVPKDTVYLDYDKIDSGEYLRKLF